MTHNGSKKIFFLIYAKFQPPSVSQQDYSILDNKLQWHTKFRIEQLWKYKRWKHRNFLALRDWKKFILNYDDKLYFSVASLPLCFVQSGIFAIGNPERHMRKASHCGSKQQ